MDDENKAGRHPSAILRIVSATTIALSFAVAVYLLLEATRPDGGLVSFSFLLVLPAALSAFVAYVSDPLARRSHNFYLLVPAWLGLLAIGASMVFLREGVICVVILSPLWLVAGLAGAELTYRLRSRVEDRIYCSALFLVPLLAMQIEPMISLPVADASVTRSILVEASPECIWPLLEGIPDVRPAEGAWNFTQNVIGVPRPLGARLVGVGVGAVRLASWEHNIRFDERIIHWRPGRRIAWRFDFHNGGGWAFTDRHLLPDSPYFRVTTGGYRMEPLARGRTRLTIETNYTIRTPLNGYSRLWGEFFLGDLETNLLALVQGRAEARCRPERPARNQS